MSDVLISASISIDPAKTLADARLLQAELAKILGTPFAGAAGGAANAVRNGAIPIQINLAPDLARQVQAQLDKATFKIRIDPQMTGGAGPLLSHGRGGMTDRRLAQYLLDIQEAIEHGGGGGGGFGGGGAGGGGGGGGGRSRFRNPLGAYGLSRLLGSGLAAYGAVSALHFGTSLIEANRTASRTDLVLDPMMSFGDRHAADSTIRSSAADIARTRGSKQILEAIESLPLIGNLARFTNAITGSTRALEDQERAANAMAELRRFNQAQGDLLESKAAEFSNDPVEQRRVKNAQDRRADEAAFTVAQAKRDTIYQGTQSSVMDTAGDVVAKANRRAQADLEVEKAKQAFFDKDEDRQEDLDRAENKVFLTSLASTQGAGIARLKAAGARAGFSGNPVEAMRQKHQAERDALQNELTLVTSDKTASQAQIENAKERYASQKPLLDTTQATEADDQRRRRDVEAMTSARKIKSITEETAEAMEKAMGHSYKAQTDAMRRHTAESLAGIQEQIRGTRDLATIWQKGAEWWATATAGARAIETLNAAGRREADLAGVGTTAALGRARTGNSPITAASDEYQRQVVAIKLNATLPEEEKLRLLQNAKQQYDATVASATYQANIAGVDSGNALARAGLAASGQSRAAELKSIEDQHAKTTAEIRMRYMSAGPPGKEEKAAMDRELQNAHEQRDAAKLTERARYNRETLSIADRGIDAAARAHGQAGVGGVLELENEIRRMYQDAKGDPARTKLVDQYRDAEVAAKRRELRPQAGIRHGGAEYHDVLQASLFTAYGHREALNRLGDVAHITAKNAGSPEQQAGKASGDMQKAVNDFGKYVGELKRKKAI